MTQEDRQILLKDLCGRLPYSVKINENTQGDFTVIGLTIERVFTTCETEGCHNDFPVECVKPYLFPLSSMTKKTLEELSAYIDIKNAYVAVEFFNSHHIDYRGLIEKGLAIDATGLNIY